VFSPDNATAYTVRNKTIEFVALQGREPWSGVRIVCDLCIREFRPILESRAANLAAQLAAVTAGRDRLREAVIQARDHTVSYAKYLREFHWSNTADEFDELRAKLNEALAATEPKGE